MNYILIYRLHLYTQSWQDESVTLEKSGIMRKKVLKNEHELIPQFLKRTGSTILLKKFAIHS